MTVDTEQGVEQIDEQDVEQQDDDAAEQIDEDQIDEDAEQDVDEPADDAETFTRTYVERLRRENQRYRDRAGEADTLAQRLHTALVAATGKLADPTDLEFDAAHLDDADTLAAAIDTLIERKPHLRSRRPFGDIGQGATRSDETVDLAGILRQRA